MNKNWDNLKEGKCPFCKNRKLVFRLKGTNNRIKGGKSLVKDDYYFCLNGNCTFQITKTKMENIQKKPLTGENKEAIKIMNEILLAINNK